MILGALLFYTFITIIVIINGLVVVVHFQQSSLPYHKQMQR